MITNSDKIRIIEAITNDGCAKCLLEDVIQGPANRAEVEKFLRDCFTTLVSSEKSQPSLKEVLRERAIADEKALRAKKASDSRSRRETGRR